MRRGGAERADVGDAHAVDVPRRLIARRTLRDIARLLSRGVATNVVSIEEHAGGLLHDDPRIASARNVLELDFRYVDARTGFTNVEQRRFGGYSDGLCNRRIQRHRDVRVLRDAHSDACACRRSVAGQLRLEAVRAGREADETKVSERTRDAL